MAYETKAPICISMDWRLLATVERERAKVNKNRSEFIAEAIREKVRPGT